MARALFITCNFNSLLESQKKSSSRQKEALHCHKEPLTNFMSKVYRTGKNHCGGFVIQVWMDIQSILLK